MAKQVKNVSDLKNKMTAEKAMEFLKKAQEEKIASGVKIMDEAIKKLDGLGLAIAVKNGLNESNQITNTIQVVLK